MSIVFVDLPEEHARLKPLTFTRPACELRLGMDTIREKWEAYLGETKGYNTLPYLSQFYRSPQVFSGWMINGTVLPNPEIVAQIKNLEIGEFIECHGSWIAARVNRPDYSLLEFKKIGYSGKVDQISRCWELFLNNGKWLREDYSRLSANRKSAEVTDKHTIVYGNQLFVGEHVKIKAGIINTETGPVFIDDYAEIQEGSLIRGPVYIGKHSVVNMGAKIKGDTTIGPYCKVGGEVSNSILFGYSNKGHDGFLGNSILGEWCNLGAGTNNSNLKNNYAEIKMWDYESGSMISTGLQFCGLVMGDHSKCGINTMFNTGTTIGVGCNIYGSGFPPNHIPSFSWGGQDGFETYNMEKFYETANLVMARRGKHFSEGRKAIFGNIFELTLAQRANNH